MVGIRAKSSIILMYLIYINVHLMNVLILD
jgi:hypothetical protein